MKIQDITFEKKRGGFGGGAYQMIKSGRTFSVNTCADMRLYARRASSVKVSDISQICANCPGGDTSFDCPLIARIIDSWI